jgi:Ca2+-binding EF-hand superfamily protein
MNTLVRIGTVALVATAMSYTAVAQGQQKKARKEGARPRVPLAQLITSCDTDGDGNVSYADITAKRPRFPEQAFSRLDSNSDGVLTGEEVREVTARRGQGRRGPAAAGSRSRGQRGPAAAGSRGHGPRGPRAEAGPGSGPRAGNRGGARNADTNGDGKISFEEVQAAHPEATRERFDARDRNGDGFLSREDRRPR